MRFIIGKFYTQLLEQVNSFQYVYCFYKSSHIQLSFTEPYTYTRASLMTCFTWAQVFRAYAVSSSFRNLSEKVRLLTSFKSA